MKAKYAALFLPLLAFGAGGGPEAKTDLGKFAGAWTVSELKYDGEVHKLKFKITFKGDVGIVEGNDEVQREYARIKFKLDPASSPKNMDISVVGGSQTDSKMVGVYELKDDELRLCVKVFGTDRPKEFAAPDGSSTVLLVLKRATP